MRSQKAHIRLLVDRVALLTCLPEEGPNEVEGLEPVADRHVDVHDDQCVGWTGLRELFLDHGEGLVAIRRTVASKAVLLEEVDERDRAEEVILDDQNLLRMVQRGH